MQAETALSRPVPGQPLRLQPALLGRERQFDPIPVGSVRPQVADEAAQHRALQAGLNHDLWQFGQGRVLPGTQQMEPCLDNTGSNSDVAAVERRYRDEFARLAAHGDDV